MLYPAHISFVPRRRRTESRGFAKGLRNVRRIYKKRDKRGKYPEYKAVGIGYIRFAVEEPELFKFLFMRKRESEDSFEKNSFDKSTFLIMKNYGLYKDDAFKLHAEMWIFVHGIATMFATGYLDWDWDTVSDMVTDAYQGLMWRRKQGEYNDNKH